MITITTLNEWGRALAAFAGTMLLQSSLLILALALLDSASRRKIPAVTRYALWLLLLIKLVLPTSLSLPTGVFQVTSTSPRVFEAHSFAPPAQLAPQMDFGSGPVAAPGERRTQLASPAVEIDAFGLAFLAWLAGMLSLSSLIVWRCRILSLRVSSAAAAPAKLADLLEECRARLNLRRNVCLKVTPAALTPCVSGIFRPAILIPAPLMEALPEKEMRAVIMHELVHLKRGDLWVNLAQTALQVFYFFHPLLWWANARIRALREEAVDEATVVALGREGATYPEALLNVAKLALAEQSPLFGTLGVLESQSALGKRVRRLLENPLPRSARLGIGGISALLLLGLILLPMARAGGGKEPDGKQVDIRRSSSKNIISFSATATAPVNPEDPHQVSNMALDDLLREFEPYDFRSRRLAAVRSELTHRPELVPFLISKLKKDRSQPDTREKAEARRKAANLLGGFKSSAAQAVPLLIDCLEDEEEVRREATMALGNIGPAAKAAIPTLIEELQFQNTAAGPALAQIAPDSESVLNQLLEAILDPSKTPQFRSQTIPALGFMRVKNDRLNTALADLEKSPDVGIREAAQRLHGPAPFRGGPAPKVYSPADVPKLMQRLADYPDDFDAAHGLRALGTNAAPALETVLKILREKKARFPGNLVNIVGAIGPAARESVPLLVDLTRGDDGMLVRNVLGALRMIGPDAIAALDRLLQLLHDPDREISWMAANALMTIDPSETPRCIPVLLQALDSPRETRAFKIWRLGELGAAARPLVPDLFKLLKEDEFTRLAAADAIAKLAPERRAELVPVLTDTLRDEKIMNRPQAARILSDFGALAEASLPFLEQAQHASDNPHLVEAARQAVEKIKASLPSTESADTVENRSLKLVAICSSRPFYEFNGKRMELAELKRALADAAARDPAISVNIRREKDGPVENVTELIDACRAARVPVISILPLK